MLAIIQKNQFSIYLFVSKYKAIILSNVVNKSENEIEKLDATVINKENKELENVTPNTNKSDKIISLNCLVSEFDFVLFQYIQPYRLCTIKINCNPKLKYILASRNT
jgi:hypothetical protein